MAYNNFKATIWSKVIQTELEQKAIFADFCNTNFEGEAKNGKTVRILNAAAPTIGTYNQAVGLSDPETQEGTSVDLVIDQAKYFNLMVDDIDRAQTIPTLMETITRSAATGLAGARDQYIASLAQNADESMKAAATAYTTAAAVKKAIDAGLLALRENNVALDADVRIELPFWMYQLFRDQLVELKTNNDDLLKKGIVGWYDGAQVVASNNIYLDSGTSVYYAMIRTKNAVGLATQITETEAYRPDKFFSDAVRGLMVYGAKIVRPKELYVIQAKKS